MNRHPVIALTGGPGGGKSALIEDLRRDPAWSNCFVALPEAAAYARFTNISSDDKLFQRVIVRLQMGLEDALVRSLDLDDPRCLLCHRGSLDALAFWKQRGWLEDEFFDFTETTLEQHYQRYSAVIHLVTSADGVPEKYTRWPQAHRPEDAQEAIRLDRWLQQAWGGHPRYFCIDNNERDWPSKAQQARNILAEVLREEQSLNQPAIV